MKHNAVCYGVAKPFKVIIHAGPVECGHLEIELDLFGINEKGSSDRIPPPEFERPGIIPTQDIWYDLGWDFSILRYAFLITSGELFCPPADDNTVVRVEGQLLYIASYPENFNFYF